jgi:DNA-binding beta-propeller fold protein YncE
VAQFDGPLGVALDGSGNLYVADQFNRTVRKVTPAGSDWVVSTVAGRAGVPGSADGVGGFARFGSPQAVAVDTAGNVFVADGNHTVRKIAPDRTVTTIAGTAGAAGSLDGIGPAARFNLPSGIAVDTAGFVYVSDAANNTIRQISPTGKVVTLAGLPGAAGAVDGTGFAARFLTPSGLALDPSGPTLYVADQNNHTIRTVR